MDQTVELSVHYRRHDESLDEHFVCAISFTSEMGCNHDLCAVTRNENKIKYLDPVVTPLLSHIDPHHVNHDLHANLPTLIPLPAGRPRVVSSSTLSPSAERIVELRIPRPPWRF